MENVERELISTYKYNKETAREYVRSGGRCTYCGIDVLADWHQYHLAAIDHLLPQSAFPELAMEQNNLVLSCGACNSIKRAFNPLGATSASEGIREYLQINRQTLIGKSRDFINGKVKAADDQRQRILGLIRQA